MATYRLYCRPTFRAFKYFSGRAFDVFYESDTCRRFHDPDTGLYLYGDLYVVDEVIRELQDKQG